jgi:antitoxin PrlF
MFAKLTSKFHVTIPQEIRSALGLKAGDRITFEIQSNNNVIIKKAAPLDVGYLQALESTLNEWKSENDDEDLTIK